MNSNNLSRLRDDACLSQRDLAEKVNAIAAQQGRNVSVTSNSISRWERGGATPSQAYRRLLAAALGVTASELGFGVPHPRPPESVLPEVYVADPDPDPRVARSRAEWCRTRRNLNATRHALSQVAADLYPEHRMGDTGLITRPDWLPDKPVDITAISLTHTPADPPTLDGTESVTEHLRPRQTLVRRYARYTQAIRDLAHPRLFENRMCWRLTDLGWTQDKGNMTFGDTTYFAATDCFEAASHELALVALDGDGHPHPQPPTMRDLPFRKHLGDPFDLTRRPLMAAVSTLTIRRSQHGGSLLLHRRDPRSVTIAGGMLQVIPSGIFQPSSLMPGAVEADFDLWRNIMREYSEELLGNVEHDGDGQPVNYGAEPFRSLDEARAQGRIKVHCLGVALDALSLVGEILTVAVWDADVFDAVAGEFVEVNDEGQVIGQRVPFTEDALRGLRSSGRMAPAGAGCLDLAWKFRNQIIG